MAAPPDDAPDLAPSPPAVHRPPARAPRLVAVPPVGAPEGVDDGRAEETSTAGVERHVPMTHRADRDPDPSPRVDGPLAAVLVVVVPAAFVYALLLVPSGPARGVVVLVAWLVVAVVAELWGSARRRRGRRTRRGLHGP